MQSETLLDKAADAVKRYAELRAGWRIRGCKGKGVEVRKAHERVRKALAESREAEAQLSQFEKRGRY